MVSEVLGSDSFKFKMHIFSVTVEQYFNTDAQCWSLWQFQFYKMSKQK